MAKHTAGLSLKSLSLIKDDERRRMLEEWNDTATAYPADLCIHQLFEQQVTITPEASALILDEATLNYRQLEAHANQLAHFLRRMGTKPETLIALCLERSFELFIGILGILKAGGAYVPLDPSYPKDRLHFMLHDSAASILITALPLEPVFSGYHGRIVCLDRDQAMIASEPASTPPNLATAHNLAYIIYTSGSTGRPKGVMIEHRSICNLANAQARIFQIHAQSRVLQFASASFDASVSEWSTALSRGAALCLLEQNGLSVTEALIKIFRENRVTVATLPPSVIAALPQEALSGLETLVVAGEACTEAIIQSWRQKLHLINAYGPTEATVCASTFICKEGYPASTIGRPMDNIRLYVLDKRLEPTPVGIVGELFIGGDSLARGYLNRPEKTKERFFSDPFAPQKKSRLYRTGDLVRYLPDGNIEFVGRADNQVKIRGFRVELEEIESVLCQHQAVKSAVVLALEGETGQKQLAACISPSNGANQPSLQEELQRYLKTQLPEYMLPARFAFIDVMPLTANGKIDRAALRDLALRKTKDSYHPPTNEIEKILASLWEEILQIECADIHGNFFELGGDSLICIQMVSRAQQQGIQLNINQVFATPTIAELAKWVKQNGTAQIKPHTIPRVPRNDQIPLSFAQQRLWFLHESLPDKAVYNVPLALRLRGRLDQQALEEAFRRLLQRHEILRTTIHRKNGQAVQCISKEVAFSLHRIDLSHLPEKAGDAEFRNRAVLAVREAFDLTSDPLIRAELLCLRAEEHVVLIIMHHMMVDAWSMDIFSRELRELYNAGVEKRSPALPELPIQYADFAVWQREWMVGEILEQQLSYWQKQLENTPEFLQLPTDKPRPAAASYQGAFYQHALSAELSNKVKLFSTDREVTPFMTLLAVLQMLLYRYSGEREVIVGSPAANRHYPETRNMLGFVANAFALRAVFEKNMPFNELVQQVRQTTLAAYENQDIPFEKIVEALRPSRAANRHPIFQIIFDVQNLDKTGFELVGLKSELVRIDSPYSRFDLTVAVQMSSDGFTLGFEYATDIFNEATIVRLSECFAILLEQAMAQPDAAIDSFSLLTPVERQKMLRTWNATQTGYPFQHCIHQLFEAQAEKSPRAIALLCGDEELSYAELNACANQLARHLQRKGVGAETLVGLSVKRSFEMIISLLGILKAGGAYVPLDPDYPHERLQFMMTDSNVTVLVTTFDLSDRFSQYQGSVVLLDRDAMTISQEVETNLSLHTSPNGLAYVIYTSGSTGKPKGVMVKHASICNLANFEARLFNIQSGARVLQFASLSFDAAVWEWAVTLAYGGTLCLGPSAGTALVEALRKYQINIATLPPSLVTALPEEALSGLDTLVVAGEACSEDIIKKWQHRLQLWNAYGPTEAAVCATIFRCNDRYPAATIGRPIDNVQAYVLDQHLQPLPIDVPGELYIGGAGLARGYLNHPELTNKQFIKNPFDELPNAKLYKTGDRAKFLPDGNIEFLGRIDHQIKLRGYRIEPGEIEAIIIAGDDRIQSCAVILRENSVRQKQLAAYLVMSAQPDDQNKFLANLRQFLQTQLPDFMIPTEIHLLKNMPLTPSGKIDRQALSLLDENRDGKPAVISSEKRTGSATEEKLSRIWSELLHLSSVGGHDDFFELGGDSISAIHMITLAAEQGIRLEVNRVFATPTIAALAETIVAAPQELADVIPRIPRDYPIALSFAQERLWFLDQLLVDRAVYNIPLVVRLSGELDIAALQQAFAQLVLRHEILRTSIRMHEGKACQYIESAKTFLLEQVDLTNTAESDYETTFRQIAIIEAKQNFDLSQGALPRAKLLCFSKRDHVLVLALHHIMADAWSMQIFADELSSLYASCKNASPLNLDDLPIQYADFAVWQRNQKLQESLAYWKKQLAGAPQFLNLPSDHPRPKLPSHHGACCFHSIAKESLKKTKNVAEENGATLFMTLLAVFQLLLYKYSGQDDVVVGTPVANRGYPGVNRLIGFFVNTLALRIKFKIDQTFEDLLRQTRKIALEAFQHQDLPFEKLVEALDLDRSLARAPLFQVMFSLDNVGTIHFNFPDIAARTVWIDLQTAKFDLSVTAHEHEETEELILAFEYATDLFKEDTIAEMARHYEQLLKSVTENPRGRISDFSLLTEVEEHKILREWNDTGADFPAALCAHELFEKQVEAAPDQLALVHGKEQLTYLELNDRANQLAHLLRQQGVAKETPVAICLPRSFDLVIAVLGVLKAGGAYIPLDPANPETRLNYILSDAQAPVLITASTLMNRFSEFHGQVLAIDQEASTSFEQQRHNPPLLAAPNDLAYIIYTSGSTGTPKGVMIEHQSLVNYIYWCLQTYPVKKGNGVPLHSSFAFDMSITSLFVPLAAGQKIILPTEQSDVLALVELLTKQPQQLSFIKLTPSHLQLIAAQANQLEIAGASQALILGGESLDAETVCFWTKVSPETRIFNEYGPTEATVACAALEFKARDFEKGRVPIGKPIANTELYILDPDLKPIPIGIRGELYVGGKGLARGYWNQPDLTREKFIPHPFSHDPNARLYRTGDWARYLPDGNIEFLGRLDNQIKLRGYRIELGEIEMILQQHPQVNQAVALLRGKGAEDAKLVAYIACKNNLSKQDLIVTLRTHTLKHLPPYMTLDDFVIVKIMPLTANGKIDRAALSRMKPARQKNGASNFVPPNSPLEHELVAIWQEVLNVDRIGIDDNFFTLGGNSLLMAQLVVRINESMATGIALRNFFEMPTISQLAKLIEEKHLPGFSQTHVEEVLQDINLASEIRHDDAIQKSSIEPSHLLLTGATGFLGAHLLYNLCELTDVGIYCLVRAENMADAKQRIRKNLEKYRLANQVDEERIIPVIGDLNKPQLGFSHETFHQLTDTIDAIYHNGAHVHHVYNYSVLKHANVYSTIEMLKLATTGKPKPLHYISTLSAAIENDNYEFIPEAFLTSPMHSLFAGGYAQSKWASEKLLAQAHERGVAISIYRPGSIGGQSNTGIAATENDHLLRLIKGCLQMGVAPDWKMKLDLLPVDVVSRVVAKISLNGEARGKVFNLTNPSTISWPALIGWINAHIQPVRFIATEKWRREYLSCIDESNALFPLLAIYLKEDQSVKENLERIQKISIKADNTIAMLKKFKIDYPPVDTKLLHIYFNYLLESGFIEKK